MRQAAEHAIDTTPNTRDGIMHAMAPAVSWLANPAAAEASDATGGGLFDIADFLDLAGRLYLLDDDGTVGPLVAALTAEIALVCPVPLDRWTAELRKRSITIHAA
jgi:hypothetical protein